MVGEHGGHQPVVAMKQGNACGAKGHSQETEDIRLRLTGKPLRIPG